MQALQALWNNQGNRLTPELIIGLQAGIEAELDQPIASSAPTHPVSPYQGAGPRLVIHDKERVGGWVAEQVGQRSPWGGFGAIGLEDADGELVAGFVLNNLTETNAHAHIAGVGKRWLTKTFLFACFDYAFNQLGLKRLTGLVAEDNFDGLRFDEHLGFEHEYTVPCANAGGAVIMLVMWKEKCRWIGNKR